MEGSGHGGFNPNQLTEQQQMQFAEATLGEECKNFIQSNVGRYIQGRAKMELEECKSGLLNLERLDPDFDVRYEQLRQKAGCALLFTQWMIEAITDGEAAYQQLQQQDGEEVL